MTYLQAKKRKNFIRKTPQVIMLGAVIILFYWVGVFYLKNWSIKAINFIVPERHEFEASSEALMLLTMLRDLKEENKILRAEMGFINYKKTKRAAISFGGGYLFLDNYFLKGGEDAGFKGGDLVLSNEILIGKLIEVGENWSKFQPLTKLGEKSALRSGTNKEILFEAVGLGGGELQAELPREILKVGDAVWWAENPKYLIGFIESISVRETKPESDIRIISPLKIKNLASVDIVSK